MTSSGIIGFRDGTGALPGAARVRTVEKASPSSGLNDGPKDFSQKRDRESAPLRVELVCQDETAAFDPLWDGPRLLPSFVAQVLGQALPHRNHTGARAQTAYLTAAPQAARVIDRRG